MFRVQLTTSLEQRQFLLLGEHQALVTLMQCAEREGATFGLTPPEEGEELPLLVVPTEDGVHFHEIPSEPWLVWNRLGLPGISKLAQERGAITVLPQDLSIAALFNALHTAEIVLGAHQPRKTYPHEYSFLKGDLVHLGKDRVVFIRRGVVRCTSIHSDGSEVLIGFYGQGDVLMAHASYSCLAHNCHVETRAHTPLSITVESWNTAKTRPFFYDQLKQRVCQMELWSSMQARSSAENRLLGILQVIGGRFSHETDHGTVLDIKLTHDLLASAIGATRTTVTRLLGNLRKKGKLGTVKAPLGEFLVLTPGVEQCVH